MCTCFVGSSYGFIFVPTNLRCPVSLPAPLRCLGLGVHRGGQLVNLLKVRYFRLYPENCRSFEHFMERHCKFDRLFRNVQHALVCHLTSFSLSTHTNEPNPKTLFRPATKHMNIKQPHKCIKPNTHMLTSNQRGGLHRNQRSDSLSEGGTNKKKSKTKKQIKKTQKDNKKKHTYVDQQPAAT